MAIDAMTGLGRLADTRLAEHGLILTQGGEPTFVPHDTTALEWNFAALGPEKLHYARRLARHLATRLYPGAVVLQSFGKQYPGEPLPRWQIGVYRLRDGEPLWQDLARLRLDQEHVAPAASSAVRTFLKHLAKTLGVRGTGVPVFEDVTVQLGASNDPRAARWLPRFSRRQRRFVAPPLGKSAGADWAARLAPSGWALPLDHNGRTWQTDAWKLPGRADLILIPGDSPVGLRLPLQALPAGAMRRALSVEIKDGELLVFLPPVSSLRAFGELVRAVESVVARCRMPPVRLEGYAPPRDAGLESIALTSDPGVIEVNLPPADNWEEFERILRELYVIAAASGLRGCKFQSSGRRIATGGGAHIILGGPDLARNPFMRRPALLASFLRFLQNHPSLSYVFSGLFTGPSCQAPRSDESAGDLPYELEITLAALEKLPAPVDPGMIDALLRNLLMDWNGNTHRAELSVDKFYNQAAPNGRLGLVEFRAFEMTPSVDLLLLPNLLLRALTACFAGRPFTQPLVAWRDDLHDRFALPWFLREDLRAVLDYVNGHGFAFDPAWFEPQFDFRFPIVTQFTTGPVAWTLRQAREPWPVMGDHTGTGRIVDATTDRLELLATRWTRQAPFAVLVNGRRLPLESAGRGAAVGAVRYRQTDNPWGLQPHVNAHMPLEFEIVERATGRVVHAFDYHAWRRPDDAGPDLPQTDAEAEERLRSRLRPQAGKCDRSVRLPDIDVAPQTPFTLDLRRAPSASPT